MKPGPEGRWRSGRTKPNPGDGNCLRTLTETTGENPPWNGSSSRSRNWKRASPLASRNAVTTARKAITGLRATTAVKSTTAASKHDHSGKADGEERTRPGPRTFFAG